MNLKSKASIQVLKPVDEVFAAVVQKEKLTNYFISESDGNLEDGVDAQWKFPEFETRFPITKVKVVDNESISFVWDPQTVVTIAFNGISNGTTVVEVEEGDKELNEENLEWLVSNSGGWANFLASLKAYVEHGINLRKGAFDFMKNDQP